MGNTNSSFAIKSDNSLWGWGYNASRALGDGTTTNVNTPKKVGGGTNDWKVISSGENNTLAIKQDGTLWGWGSNQYGELGNGSTVPVTTPTMISAEKWRQVASGASFSVGIKEDGSIWYWGLLFSSSGGRFTQNQITSPTAYVPSLKNLKWANLSMGREYVLAVTEGGEAYGYGDNSQGQIDHSSSGISEVLRPIQIEKDFERVCATGSYSIGLKKDGSLYEWGSWLYQSDTAGVHGGRSYPRKLGTSNDWVSVVGTRNHAMGAVLALKKDGTIWTMGNNALGGLGRDSTAENQKKLVQVGPDKFVAIAAGQNHLQALKSDGTLWSWGANNYGQVGNGTESSSVIYPTQVLSSVKSISDVQNFSWNESPVVSLLTTNNKTLYENDAFLINGTTIDTDNGDVVTVKYQIDSGTVRNLHSGISDGATPIPFTKNLTYSEGVLKDGNAALTSVLSKDSPHVISVWSEDDNGGKSAVETRTFYVVPNRPPTITVDPIAPQSDLINSNVINVSGSVGDLDNNDVVVTFQINDKEPQEVHNGAPGIWAFNILLKDLRNGSNTVIVKATDTYNASISKVLTIKKTHDAVPLNEAIALYKINPPTGSAQKILMWIERMIGDLSVTAEVSMTNEGEPENFVSLPKTNSGPKVGLTEDEFAYDALAPKTNIVVKIKYSRTDSAAVAAIKKISGVLS